MYNKTWFGSLFFRPEMVVGWYHSHPGFGCWLSGVDINTQQVCTVFAELILGLCILCYWLNLTPCVLYLVVTCDWVSIVEIVYKTCVSL